jgi:predicted Rossmann fold nucleotide-binding protein DprA/Smf involved in DNA uptake
MGGFGPPTLPYLMEIYMAKQLVKIVNTETGKAFDGVHLKNANLIAHAENNLDHFEMVYMDIKEEDDKKSPYTVAKLMGKSVKELQKIAAEKNISFGVPVSHLNKAEIANVIIESTKGIL